MSVDVMTPDHVRTARAALRWSVRKLGAEAGLAPNTVVSYEAGRHVMPATVAAIHRTLLLAGVEFEQTPTGLTVRFMRKAV